MLSDISVKVHIDNQLTDQPSQIVQCTTTALSKTRSKDLASELLPHSDDHAYPSHPSKELNYGFTDVERAISVTTMFNCCSWYENVLERGCV